MEASPGDSLNAPRAKGTSPIALIPLGAIRFYQKVLSPQSVPACNFHPTCSHFSFQAFKRYGALRGLLMTSDRLQRCNYWARGHYPWAEDGRHLYDPVENHLLWGKPKPEAQTAKSEQTEPTPLGIPNSYQPAGIWGFAEYLFRMGDYQRACTEYQRFINLSPQAPQAEEADYKIGICLDKKGEYSSAIDHFKRWRVLYPQGNLVKQAKFHLGYSYFLLGDYEKANNIFTQLRGEVKSKVWQSKAKYMIGWGWLRRKNWSKAYRAFKKMANSTTNQNEANHLKEIANLTKEGKSLPRRNPALAALFSALLPGSGRAYCRRLGDALYSFMLIGGTAYASRYYHLHRHPSQSLIFGSMSLFFYAGDIYGSIKGAEIFNRQAQEDLQNQIEEKLKELSIINE